MNSHWSAAGQPTSSQRPSGDQVGPVSGPRAENRARAGWAFAGPPSRRSTTSLVLARPGRSRPASSRRARSCGPTGSGPPAAWSAATIGRGGPDPRPVIDVNRAHLHLLGCVDEHVNCRSPPAAELRVANRAPRRRHRCNVAGDHSRSPIRRRRRPRDRRRFGRRSWCRSRSRPSGDARTGPGAVTVQRTLPSGSTATSSRPSATAT